MNIKNAANFEIIGNVSETRISEKFAKITTCSNVPYKDGGEWKSDPHWNQTTVFSDKLREIARDLKKGDLVKIKGRMKNGSYMKNGQRVFTVDLIAYNVELVSRKNPKTLHEEVA